MEKIKHRLELHDFYCKNKYSGRIRGEEKKLLQHEGKGHLQNVGLDKSTKLKLASNVNVAQIHLPQNRGKWWDFVNTRMKFGVP